MMGRPAKIARALRVLRPGRPAPPPIVYPVALPGSAVARAAEQALVDVDRNYLAILCDSNREEQTPDLRGALLPKGHL